MMGGSDYRAFVDAKRASIQHVGIDVDVSRWPLFPHQADMVRWALRVGRAALFADTGMGKTRMQLVFASESADATGLPSLVVAPLAVNEQTIREGERIGVHAAHAGTGARVQVVNYDRIHKIEPADYGCIVLDESSILKSSDGATRNMLIESFAGTRFRLACTATPAPNDYTELGSHAHFLGVSTREEMLAEFFVHDGGSTQDWRIKGHARRDFWRWVASWAALVRKPSDLGHPDDGFDLPPLSISERVVSFSNDAAHDAGLLFADASDSLSDQRAVRRATIEDRAAAIAEIVAREPDEQWLIWGELNDECDAIQASIPGAVQVRGSDDRDDKSAALLGFASGDVRVLVTKPSIAGFGMNWQGCARQVFAGVGHSYEQFYQAVRRSWRFGQTRPVEVVIVRSSADAGIAANLRRKADAADAMAAEMLDLVRDSQLESVRGIRPGRVDAAVRPVVVPDWLWEVHHARD